MTLHDAYTEWSNRPNSGRDHETTLEVLAAEEMTQMQTEKLLQRTGHTEQVVSLLGEMDSFTANQQLRDITAALTELAVRVGSVRESAAMASFQDDLQGALGWVEAMLTDTPTDSKQDAAESYGGSI